jgi:hypothetical protein
MHICNTSRGFVEMPVRRFAGRGFPDFERTQRYCYITVDSAMAASQNGICSYKIFIHKKTYIMQIMTKILLFFYLIFCHTEIVKLDHFMTLSLSYAHTVL